MDFYSNSKPDLIGPKVKKSVYKIIKKNTGGAIISDKISDVLMIFYKNYISPNMFTVVIFVVVIIFLLYRYYNKGTNNDEEKFTQAESNIIDEIFNDQTSHLKYDSQPTLDILQSVNEHSEPINYPPDPLPINIPDKGIIHTKNLYNYPQPYANLNNPNYNYNNVYEHPSRSYYTGTYNTYADAQDTNIVNPYDWSNNFNTTTGDFVGQMTDANTRNIVDYQTILDNTQSDLLNSVKYGPQYLTNDIEDDMEPPYAKDDLF